MNRKELIEAVAEKNAISKVKAEEVVSDVFGTISAGLAKGEEIQIHGFGTFKPVERAPRVGRNPRTGEEIQIAASKSVKFVPGKALKS